MRRRVDHVGNPPDPLRGRSIGIESNSRDRWESPSRRHQRRSAAEALRVKAFLVVQRNVVRDFLDVVALVEHMGTDAADGVLSGIDHYYVDRSGDPASVLTSLVIALAEPSPRDTDVISELPRYKGLEARWHRWSDVVDACRASALRLSGAA